MTILSTMGSATILTYIKKLNSIIERRVDDFGAQYFALALFYCLNHPIFYIMWKDLTVKSYENFFLRCLGTIISIPLLFTPYWPAKVKKWLPLYWYFMITFNLPYFFIFMSLMNNASISWLMSTTVIAFWLLFLVDWPSYLAITFVGVIAAFITFFAVGHPSTHHFNLIGVGSIGLTFQCIATIIIIVVFARNKIKTNQEKFMSMRILGDCISHEVSTPLLAITSGIAGIKNHLIRVVNVLQNENISLPGLPQAKTLNQIPFILNNIEKESEHIANFIEVINSNVLHKKQPALLKNRLDIHDCLKEVLEHCIYLTSSKIELEVQSDIHFFLVGDEILVKNIINNLLKNAVYSIRKARKGKLSIFTTQTSKYNELHIKDTGLGIAKKEKKKIFEPFYSTKEKGEGTGIGLAFCKIAMNSMDGHILLQAEADQYAEFILQFPKVTPSGELN